MAIRHCKNQDFQKKVHSCTHQQLSAHINHFDVTRKKTYQTWRYTND